MDIQKMVDERLEELRTQTIRISRPFSNGGEPQIREFSAGEMPPDSFTRSREEFLKLEDLMDSSLTEVAERVLEITDRVAGDYARMEKDILDSRLALLQSAEAVLDIAISLRRKARSMIKAGGNTQTAIRNHVRPTYDDEYRESYDLHEGLNDGRVSMHEQGVASLFRRT
ncbi:MAG: hypothetical protein M1539_05290 [Actinobacteria bacterium]|nr:hypothetical protein [Actinomycetota bacterium]MCL5883374.1 hypothetical protein [Actinomycetota bacterium]